MHHCKQNPWFPSSCTTCSLASCITVNRIHGFQALVPHAQNRFTSSYFIGELLHRSMLKLTLALTKPLLQNAHNFLLLYNTIRSNYWRLGRSITAEFEFRVDHGTALTDCHVVQCMCSCPHRIVGGMGGPAWHPFVPTPSLSPPFEHASCSLFALHRRCLAIVISKHCSSWVCGHGSCVLRWLWFRVHSHLAVAYFSAHGCVVMDHVSCGGCGSEYTPIWLLLIFYVVLECRFCVWLLVSNAN